MQLVQKFIVEEPSKASPILASIPEVDEGASPLAKGNR